MKFIDQADENIPNEFGSPNDVSVYDGNLESYQNRNHGREI